MVPKQAPPIILDRKPVIGIVKNGGDTKHTRHISRGIHFVINGEQCNFHKTVWYEGGLQLTDIVIKKVWEDAFNPILGYDMARFDY